MKHLIAGGGKTKRIIQTRWGDAGMERISEYVNYAEAIKSQTAIRNGILNAPGPVELEAMRLVAVKVFDPVRAHFGVPLRVSSFYRCRELNRLVGGVLNSQHVKGEAIDIDGDGCGVSNAEIFEFIRKHLDFDQLINEFHGSWVHVSYRAVGNRRECFAVG
jgi:zinc D-Ala-D-Ala carboxypeptidase